MVNSVQDIIQNLQMFYADGLFLILGILSYIYLFVRVKMLRWKFLLPIALIEFCVLNPILYRYIFHRIIYWRLFWMFPDAIIIALAIVHIIKQTKSRWIKILIYCIFVGLIVIKGTNVYQNAKFELIQNPQKVSSETQIFCTQMLMMSEHPKCIAPRELYSEIRQYNGDIEMLYGRNAEGYINALDDSDIRKLVSVEMDEEVPDYNFILSVAVDENVTAVIVHEEKQISEKILSKYGYKEIFADKGYILYYLKV